MARSVSKSATNRTTRRPPAPAGNVSAPSGQTGRPRRGTYVEVARGPAQGARGRVVESGGGSITIVATVLGQRPLLLTVDSATCTLLSAPPDGW